MAAWSLLGLQSFASPEIARLLFQAEPMLRPLATQVFSDLPGAISRLGDMFIWQGAGGRQYLLGLEAMGDHLGRIEQAVSGIETAQLAMQSTLGVVQSVSLASLGITSLSAGFMLWRLNAINTRLDRLSRRIADVEGQIDAAHKAHLRSGLQFLSDFEDKQRPRDLERAIEEARTAGNIYGQLTQDEAQAQRRLAVLNYRSRYYLLALLTEIECLIQREDQKSALDRIAHEQPRLKLLSQTIYSETISKAPEAYLDPELKSDGVTLELLTEVYRQAHQAGAMDDVEIRDANQMFEYVREGLFRRRTGGWWVWTAAGAEKQRYLERLKYLLACVEDINRIGAIRVLIGEAESQSLLVRDLLDQIRTWRKERPAERDQPGTLFTYSFA